MRGEITDGHALECFATELEMRQWGRQMGCTSILLLHNTLEICKRLISGYLAEECSIFIFGYGTRYDDDHSGIYDETRMRRSNWTEMRSWNTDVKVKIESDEENIWGLSLHRGAWRAALT